MDGFRIGSVKYILEATHLRDEPQVDPNKPAVSSTSFICYIDGHHNSEALELKPVKWQLQGSLWSFTPECLNSDPSKRYPETLLYCFLCSRDVSNVKSGLQSTINRVKKSCNII